MKSEVIQSSKKWTPLERKISELGPWHFKMKIEETGKFTTDYHPSNVKKKVRNVVNPNTITHLLKSISPAIVKNKTFMDIGCNGGGYCFIANKLGARYTYGFDVRKQWIDQCQFLRDDVFKIDPKKMHFEVAHIHDLKNRNDQFDVTLFKGVLYHIPDVIESLKTVCDMTKDILILNTAGSNEAGKDCMKVFFENPNSSMAGIDNMAWLPGSADQLQRLLSSFGFKHSRVFMNIIYPARPHLKRVGLVAVRDEKMLKRYDRLRRQKGLPLDEELKSITLNKN